MFFVPASRLLSGIPVASAERVAGASSFGRPCGVCEGFGLCREDGESDIKLLNLTKGITMKTETKRKTLSAALAFFAALCACAEVTFTYTLADGGATITGASNVGTCLDIPETIDGYPVVAIGNSAFNFELDLEHLTIPSSVTNIGKHAFSLCHGMEEIVIPDSVKNISDYAFYKCYDVERIEIGSGVRTIGNWAFGECYALKDLLIAHGVECINKYAFLRRN